METAREGPIADDHVPFHERGYFLEWHDIHPYDTQYNDIQDNDTQRKGPNSYSTSEGRAIMLSVVMLNVTIYLLLCLMSLCWLSFHWMLWRHFYLFF